MERLDKTLSTVMNITRTQAKSLIRGGSVCVNSVCVTKAEHKCSEDDVISVNGKALTSSKYVYIMMNKPKGVVSASEDRTDKTVIDLLPEDMRRKGLFPAGRLDKDTTGFVLITDDGEFAHAFLSPKRHVEKEYLAVIDKPFDDAVREDFEKGVTLDGKALLPARLEAVGEDKTHARIVIRQGIYHQIKRMFKKHGLTVLELKRERIGNLALDKTLSLGEARYITEEELLLIR